jgi:hypothetical protein
MNGALIIFILTVTVYLPLTAVLLYVWWKHGKGESGVAIARAVFLLGSVLIFACLITR